MSVKVTGGDKLKKLSEAAKRMPKIKGYRVGVIKANYADGTQVATVAAAHEFGAGNLPERPFFRQANEKAKKTVPKILISDLKKNHGILKLKPIEVAAEVHKGTVQKSITSLKSPPNSPTTVNIKKSSNPLVDTGLLRQSISWVLING